MLTVLYPEIEISKTSSAGTQYQRDGFHDVQSYDIFAMVYGKDKRDITFLSERSLLTLSCTLLDKQCDDKRLDNTPLDGNFENIFCEDTLKEIK